MKKRQTMQLTIPKPCSEDWSAMASSDMGRYCNSCEKTVIDFTKMTDQELKDVFNKIGKEKVCGRFRENQLDRTITDPTLTAKRTWIPSALLSVFLMFGQYEIASSQENRTIQTVKIPSKQASQKEEDKTVSSNNKSSIIKGRVIDFETEEGVPGVTVALKNTEIKVLSDPKGLFSLEIPENRSNQSFIIIFRAIGYQSKELEIDTQDIASMVVLKLEIDTTTLSETVIVGGACRASIFRRFFNLFRKKHR